MPLISEISETAIGKHTLSRSLEAISAEADEEVTER